MKLNKKIQKFKYNKTNKIFKYNNKKKKLAQFY